MAKNGIVIVVVLVVAIGSMFYFTNIPDLAGPIVEKTINSTEKAASNVTIKGNDVVSEIKTVSTSVQNITSQIKIKNPYS